MVSIYVKVGTLRMIYVNAVTNSRNFRRDILTNLIYLTFLEEEIILKRIINLNDRGFLPK